MDGIKEVLQKISNYNIFNYLLPGVLFPVLCQISIGLDIKVENDLFGIFLYYFIGMVISRIGSIFIEPFLKWTNFIKFTEYKKYVQASKLDTKLELLSEVNNSFRTLLSMLFIILFLKIYTNLNYHYWHISDEVNVYFVLILLLLLFMFSYRKQTSFITKRIDQNLNP